MNLTLYKLGRCLAILLTLLALGACDKPASPAASTTAAAAPADEPKTLLVGYSPGFGFLNVMAAKNIQPAGYHITYKRFLDFNDMIGALIAGHIDLTEIGDAGAILSFANGADIRIVASTASNARAHGFIVGPNSTATSFADLKGQKIALSKATNGYPFFLNEIARLGLKESDFKVVEISADEAYGALASGTIGAASAIQPSEDGYLEKRGGRQLISGEGLIQNYYPYVAPTKVTKAKAPALAAFLAALRQTVQWTVGNPDAHAQLVSGQIGVSASAVKSGYAKGAQDLTPVDQTYRGNLEKTVADFTRAGVLRKPVDLGVLLDSDFNGQVFPVTP